MREVALIVGYLQIAGSIFGFAAVHSAMQETVVAIGVLIGVVIVCFAHLIAAMERVAEQIRQKAEEPAKS